MAEKQLKSLICQRSKLKSILTRANTFFETANIETMSSHTHSKFRKRLDEIQPLLDKFNEIMREIESIDEENMESHISEGESFENTYHSIVLKFESVLENAVIETNSRTGGNVTPINVKLPSLTLPNFDGSYDQWPQFAEMFKSLIHFNESIDSIQKYHYLKSCLIGEAANTIMSLNVTSANYDSAWTLLTERFENKRLIVNKHLKSIFDFPSVSKEPHASLRVLLDTIRSNLRALKSLGQPVQTWDSLIIYLITTKLDFSTRREWELDQKTNDIPNLDSIYAFLKRKCDVLDSINSDRHQSAHRQSHSIKNNNKTSFNLSTNKSNCNFCNGTHTIFTCTNFIALSSNKRLEKIRELNLCTNCLSKGHTNKQCKSTYTCKSCHKRHHTLLHLQSNEIASHSNINFDKPSSSSSTNHSVCGSSQIILSTACVKLMDKYRRPHNCRVLLDSGSQSNFITTKMCNILGAPISDANVTIAGVNQTLSNIRSKTMINLLSNSSSYQSNISCLVLDKITDNLPQFSFNKSTLDIPQNLTIADPKFNKNSEIDMLIGSDTFWKLICVGQIQLGKNLPTLQKTKLGWVLAGPIPLKCHKSRTVSNLAIRDSEITRFWEIEEIASELPLTPEEAACENNFITTTRRDNCGRFIVNLPLRENANELGESRHMALKRFYSLENKLARHSELRDSYTKFMAEYEQLGHMSLINEYELQSNLSYYLPHHPVIKESSTTTKLRVVFDGSAQTDSGISLNSIQMVGPTIQRDLFSILIRFRRHNYALTADIAKMYRQVLITQKQRPLQRILWRSSPSENVKCYQLNTITYGTASASFLAIRCLKQLAINNKSTYPLASSIIENDFYVDDMLTGCNTRDEIIQIREQVSTILNSAGFELRKWLSNDASTLTSISETNADESIDIIDTHETKTLGLLWNSKSDSFHYHAKLFNNNRVTKRTILSMIAQIFDPLGLIAPVTINAKIIMQSLWQLKLDWDESLPQDMHTKWKKFVNNLNSLNQINASRHVMSDCQKNIELHGFCDASEAAYGACVYVKSTSSIGEPIVRLLCAKSKVAPLKQISIPRLELCGALLLARLIKKIRCTLDVTFQNEFYWSDSTIVLSWLKHPSNRWKTFVANRVSEIQTNTTEGKWMHVKTNYNPADFITRGTDTRNLVNCNLWWYGPDFLKSSASNWPQFHISSPSDVPEQRNTQLCSILIEKSELDIFEKISDIEQLKRTLAYWSRFIYNCKQSKLKEPKREGCLTLAELNDALTALISSAQNKHFHKEINDLKKYKRISNKSPILSLNPILDNKGILRVGGRLNNSNYCYNKRHPIILHNKHKLTTIIANKEHVKQLHCGPEALLASIRNKYWPIAGRNLCKGVTRNCMRCFKVNPGKIAHIMGNLPIERVTPNPPFYICGVDYAGPFLIKDRRGRGVKSSKAYLCIYVCFSTKAMHLELVRDLSTESFIASLRRFTSRRGNPLHIYSDNGTNFVGANSELKEMAEFIKDNCNQNSIIRAASNYEINWHFIPPRSPHFGGLWEAGVKSVKQHIKRVIGNASLTFDEFLTCLTQVEAVLNSRPLSPLSSDPNDLAPLTPAHFLIGRMLTGPPDPDVTNIKESRLSCFQRVQQLTQHFWKRWSKEYLSQLQIRSKWKHNASNILEIGDLVLLREDNLPSLQWRLGRVQEIHPGHDGVVRVVTVKTSTSVLKRSVMSLCAFPKDNISN